MTTIFVIVAYRQNKRVFEGLLRGLSGREVLVVDNTKNNRGYGGGANVGIKQALRQAAEWVVVLNQDLKVSKRAIEEFVEKLKKAPAGIAGPFVGGLDPRRWTTKLPSKRMDYITGSCIAIHRDVFEKAGFFYEPYFLYYEEVDLCMRAKRAGFALTHIPVAGITHEESVSLGRGSLRHQYYLARNHLLFVEHCAPILVKLYEYVRLPKTLWEHERKHEAGAVLGIHDYFLRRFGAYNTKQ